MNDSPLGNRVRYPTRVDPALLQPIPRAAARREIGIARALPFRGEDVWNAFELSWLAPSGLPRIGVLTLRVPCASQAIVESKSLKLYLGGFAQTVFSDAAAAARLAGEAVAKAVGASVKATITAPEHVPPVRDFASYCLDGLAVDVADYRYDAGHLKALPQAGADAVHTHLFRSVCPVTGQPDWGSIAIAWRGRLLQRTALLRYLVSYRQTPGFHEDAVERIFMDVRAAAAATELTVYGRFLRRGGIDINPFRSTSAASAPAMRLARQ
jgi:7-cyano-7-deazaguanine reductase